MLALIGDYPSWAMSAAAFLLLIETRLYTNNLLRNGQPIPRHLSASHIGALVGIVACFIWSIFDIAWWACIPILFFMRSSTLESGRERQNFRSS